MNELRSFIASLRDRLGVPYPLAHARPYVLGGRELVMEIQDEVGLPGDLVLVAEARNQYILTPAAQDFVDRVTWNATEEAAS